MLTKNSKTNRTSLYLSKDPKEGLEYVRKRFKKKRVLRQRLNLSRERDPFRRDNLYIIEGIGNRVEDIFLAVDEFCEIDPRHENMACVNCFPKYCCQITRPITHIFDLLPIAITLSGSYFFTEYFLDYLEYLRTYIENKELFHTRMNTPMPVKTTPCLFLNEHGQCNVWAIRPTTCRTTWALHEKCKPDIKRFDRCEAAEVFAAEEFKKLYESLGYTRILHTYIPMVLHQLFRMLFNPVRFHDKGRFWRGYRVQYVTELSPVDPEERFPEIHLKGFLF